MIELEHIAVVLLLLFLVYFVVFSTIYRVDRSIEAARWWALITAIGSINVIFDIITVVAPSTVTLSILGTSYLVMSMFMLRAHKLLVREVPLKLFLIFSNSAFLFFFVLGLLMASQKQVYEMLVNIIMLTFYLIAMIIVTLRRIQELMAIRKIGRVLIVGAYVYFTVFIFLGLGNQLSFLFNGERLIAFELIYLGLVVAIIMLATVWLLEIIANAYERLSREVERDSLTQVYNRRYLFRKGEEIASTGDFCGIAMLDIDDFKKINDRYGHPTGDMVLRTFADIIGRSLPENTIFARSGGEEFAILSYGDINDDCGLMLESIRAEIDGHEFGSEEGQVLHVTASFGYAVNEMEDIKFEELISRADKAMYQAKTSGKNKVVRYMQG